MTTPMTCDAMRKLIGEFLSTAPSGERQKLWDILTCQRGPDSPSERGDMSPAEAQHAYHLRRERKRATVEVIRAQSFGGVVGGAARYRKDIDYVTLPPEKEWDHFDRHVFKAAQALGLEVRMEEETKEEGVEVKVVATPPKKSIGGKSIGGTSSGVKTNFAAQEAMKTMKKKSLVWSELVNELAESCSGWTPDPTPVQSTLLTPGCAIYDWNPTPPTSVADEGK